jgi:hypothetical protein
MRENLILRLRVLAVSAIFGSLRVAVPPVAWLRAAFGCVPTGGRLFESFLVAEG